jgi:hypothetical protein
MEMRLQPAHELVTPEDDKESDHLVWLTGEPPREAEGQECWYLTLESGPVVIGIRVAREVK